MKKKRARRISVLLIPDDNAEPYNFRVSWLLAKVLIALGIVLALHMVLGGVFYWKYYRISAENNELERSNTQLLEDNKRVYQLSAELERMSKEQAKILSLLGVDPQARGGMSAILPNNLDNNQPMVTAKINPSMSGAEIATGSESVKEATMPSSGFTIRRRDNDSRFAANMPTLLPVEGVLTTEFSRSKEFPFRSHPGIDIAGKRGSVVLAAGDGQVVFANWTYVWGNLVIIHHGDNMFSYYGHNDRLLVHDRTFVKRGEPIALLGSSGQSSGPHLHFEVWKDGVAIDPRQILLAFRANSK
ncbi:MAG: M23 family metallopeptidase [candidate division KSB1 bacterium]|nr:M23 family metallopeptidase [candidate division KSB1 bacterium]MDZ7366363.1 M23 family metallopeptidase [candidate division KSB1 bacterium]MDZ7404018.1 M23 family metallopeptidase [candidate division KSB1 bacterium]